MASRYPDQALRPPQADQLAWEESHGGGAPVVFAIGGAEVCSSSNSTAVFTILRGEPYH